MKRRPGETFHELAARIRQEAGTCGLPSNTDPLRVVIPNVFLIGYHLWVPYCHHITTYSRTTQSAKYHSIKSLKNRN